MSLQKIICATDFSDLSNYAVGYGVSLAREFKAKLYLCHVIDLSSVTMYGEATFAFEPQLMHMEAYARDRLKRIMAEHKIDWEPVVRTGSAADEVARLAVDKCVDMVITATRGRSGLKRLILGSVTEHLMRTLPCPLLTVRGPDLDPVSSIDKKIGFERILVGCDFSPDSHLAFQYGLSLAQEYQSELYLAHVIEPPVYKDLPESVQDARDIIRKRLHKQLNDKLEELVPIEAFNWCKPITTLLAGQPHEELSKYADIQNIDLIVLGITGHGLVESLFVGSTTERVIRKAPCAVLSVRPISQEAISGDS
ncbi:universal stress protein [Deltaproteobacteria bacterium]|nr:universal stress protein [Deltaproteobacteria bacterium]